MLKLKSFAFLPVLVAALGLAAPAIAAEYKLDKSHSHVGFEVTHLMVSTVKGKFNEYDGTITYDPDKPEKTAASGTVKVASIDTDNEKRDNHLRSDDFFDVEKYPEIKFETTSVKKKGDKLHATGTLTIKDVTKKVDFPVEIRGPVTDPWGDTKIGLTAEFKIKRQDYGIRWNKTLEAGGAVVGNEVTIVLEVEADQKK